METTGHNGGLDVAQDRHYALVGLDQSFKESFWLTLFA